MDKELTVNCSPVYLNGGKHHVIVHITREDKDMKALDRADVILPEGKVVGYYGFKESESEQIFDYIRRHNDVIWDLGYDMSEQYFDVLEEAQA